MKKEYTINIKPYKDINDHFFEFNLSFLILEIIILIFVLVRKMFIEDLIGAIAFISCPVLIFILVHSIKLLLKRNQIIIDYINNKLIIKKIFKKHIYNLDQIQIKKEFEHENNPHIQTLCVLVFYYQNKKILKINAEAFERETSFKSDNILQ